MRSPALAVAWEFRQRHRFALIAFFGYVLALAIVWVLLLGPDRPLRLDPPNGLTGTRRRRPA